VARSKSQPIRVVLSNGTSISKTSSLIKAQADAVFQIGHGRPEAEDKQYAGHSKHETNRIE